MNRRMASGELSERSRFVSSARSDCTFDLTGPNGSFCFSGRLMRPSALLLEPLLRAERRVEERFVPFPSAGGGGAASSVAFGKCWARERLFPPARPFGPIPFRIDIHPSVSG